MFFVCLYAFGLVEWHLVLNFAVFHSGAFTVGIYFHILDRLYELFILSYNLIVFYWADLLPRLFSYIVIFLSNLLAVLNFDRYDMCF